MYTEVWLSSLHKLLAHSKPCWKKGTQEIWHFAGWGNGRPVTVQQNHLAEAVLALCWIESYQGWDTDACDKQICFVLMPDQPDGAKKPLVYWLQTNKAAENIYDMTYQECLAIVWAFLLKRNYLDGQRFSVSQTMMPLNASSTSPILQDDWLGTSFRLTEFDFEVLLKARIKNQTADALSRVETGIMDRILHKDNISDLVMSSFQHFTLTTVNRTAL